MSGGFSIPEGCQIPPPRPASGGPALSEIFRGPWRRSGCAGSGTLRPFLQRFSGVQLLPRRSVRLCCMASRSDRRAGADQPPACRRVVVLVGPVLFCTVGSVRLGWLGWLGYERSVQSSVGVPAEVSRNNRGAVPEKARSRTGGAREESRRRAEEARTPSGAASEVSRSGAGRFEESHRRRSELHRRLLELFRASAGAGSSFFRIAVRR